MKPRSAGRTQPVAVAVAVAVLSAEHVCAHVRRVRLVTPERAGRGHLHWLGNNF